jgi:hypothetical protein
MNSLSAGDAGDNSTDEASGSGVLFHVEKQKFAKNHPVFS